MEHIGSRFFAIPVCKPHRAILPLEVIGYVPYRPVGKSHFVPMPLRWRVDDCENDSYLPSAMTEKALANSVVKNLDPLKPYSDARLDRMFCFLRQKLGSIWHGDNFSSYAEAVKLLNFEKSAGYPYYYNSANKSEALQKSGDEIQSEVSAVVTGEERWMPFSATLKDELRTKERVEAEKTRPFNSSGIVHLLASKMMFSRQNDKLVSTIGSHPLTIGISVPGPQFVSAVLSLSSKEDCYDADGDGWDQRFHLGVARVIRELRKAFSEQRYHACIDLLYDAVYAGDTIALGVVYRMLHNKSGWENTGSDNGIYMWGTLFDAITELTGEDFDLICKELINGDDLAISINHERVSIVELADEMRKHNVLITYDVGMPRLSNEITFLSHTLKDRFVPGFGDVIVAAGNHSKLMSSLNWVKTSDTLTFEESCLAHLLGLRICLWPWLTDFLTVEEIIDNLLSKVFLTAPMKQMLHGRLSEVELLNLHLRLEASVNFLRFLAVIDYGVDRVSECPIFQFSWKNQHAKTTNQALESSACRAERQ